MRLLIDLDAETLKIVDDLAVQDDRPRKKTIERIIKKAVQKS